MNSTFCHSGVVLAGIQEQKNGSPTSPLGDDKKGGHSGVVLAGIQEE
ncbi:hypothetical protein ASZ90_008484 [hydrocarbon metagenome]|uniref:Uncharacterized protein n=1 Tax=hydrocarbon metagenome TaxID=938273 RepID=A0A0W8FLR1_9ZZZZ